ncbi:hypothetical protein K2173_014884 [Erythroxylum novogranatense]|uniref:Peptidase S54 rhomboid domain-containing protein n=1 Tax=Erythroxylum novogranatense TaxID=1862640 RepID=A0AAV8TFV8_9ROSI|nr:hypothetical protein K2173_014884 [Erythroxylum novogranatense]
MSMDIARNFGPKYLLQLYLAGAIGGSVFYLVHHAFMAASSKGQGMWTRDPSRTPGLGNSNISGSAHLGGAAVAAITWKRIRKGRFWVLN